MFGHSYQSKCIVTLESNRCNSNVEMSQQGTKRVNLWTNIFNDHHGNKTDKLGME